MQVMKSNRRYRYSKIEITKSLTFRVKDGTISGIIKRSDEPECFDKLELVGIDRNNFDSVCLNQAFFLVKLIKSFAWSR